MSATDEVQQASAQFYAALNQMAGGDASSMRAIWVDGPEATALHPIGVIFSALFIAMLSIGADSMSRSLNISNYIADVATSVSLLAVLVSMLLTRYRIRWR